MKCEDCGRTASEVALRLSSSTCFDCEMRRINSQPALLAALRDVLDPRVKTTAALWDRCKAAIAAAEPKEKP